MKTKIFFVSIGAIAILILVNFVNVIGVQSSTSDYVNDSPLFCIRSQKAVNQRRKVILTSNFLGKGLNAIQFPLLNTRMEQIQKVTEIIEKMDDKEFNKFQCLILSHFYEEKNKINIDATQLITILKQLKYNSNEPKINLYKNGIDSKNDPPTLWGATVGCFCFTYDYYPHCGGIILYIVFMILLFWPEILLFNFITKLLSIDDNCNP